MHIFSSFATCMRCGGDVCPLIGATATSANDVFFFCNGRDCHLHETYTSKTADFRSPTMFFRVVATKKPRSHFTKTPCSCSSVNTILENGGCVGQSQENSGEGSFRYRQANLSFYLSERLTESTHRWFPPQFLSGYLELTSFIR